MATSVSASPLDCAADWANRPVNYVNFWDAARFANWLHNGQPVGPQRFLEDLASELNRAVAVTMCNGPEAGLAVVDALLARGELADYHLAHAARADFLRRLGRANEARAAYESALELVHLEPERRFLEGRLRELAH